MTSHDLHAAFRDASGCSDERTTEVLDTIRDLYGFSQQGMPTIIATAAQDMPLHVYLVLVGLFVLPAFVETPIGREFLLQACHNFAARSQMGNVVAMIAQVTQTAAPAHERRH